MTIEQTSTDLQNAIGKLSTAQSLLNEYVLERREESRGILLSILSGTNALFLGDVGTAKTHHISLACKMLGLTFFDILMSETTKPDQIFGPVDIPALAEGRQQFKYQDYAPGCNVLFFDEIFKANATTLNPLLWLMNEHLFRDGDNGIVKCPTYSVFAASNEVPTDPVLKAVYDRLLLRFNVTYIKSDANLHKLVALLTEGKESPEPLFTRSEIDTLRAHVKTIKIPESITNLAIKVRRQIENTMGYKLSDRRFLAAFRVMQASAVMRGDTRVRDVDVEVFTYISWNEIQHQPRVENIVYASTSAEVVEVSTYMEMVEELRKKTGKKVDLKKIVKELKRIHGELRKFTSRYAKRCASEVADIGKQITSLIRARLVIEGIIVIGPNGDKVFKMHTHHNRLWAGKELRSIGLRHKRKADYWYTTNLAGTQRMAKKKGITVQVIDAGRK